MRIDLVGTTADFRRFRPPRPLQINHLPCENCAMLGRIGEVGLTTNRIRPRGGRSWGFRPDPATDDRARTAFLDWGGPETLPEDRYPITDSRPPARLYRIGEPIHVCGPLDPPVGYGPMHRSIFPESQVGPLRPGA